MKLHRRLVPALAVIALSGALAACSPTPTPTPTPTPPVDVPPVPAGPMAAGEASLHLGWAALAGTADTNAAVSPSSFALALAMISEGASGQTLNELNAIFGSDPSERGPAFAALRDALAGYDSLPTSVDAEDPPETPVVHQATQLSIVDGAGVVEDFLDRAIEYFGADVRNVPYEELKAMLDDWVRTHTAGLIESSAVDPAPNTVLVVQDALLFAAAWAQEFTSNERPLTFHAPDGEQQIEALWGAFEVAYAANDRFEAVRLPYDDVLAMDIVLPAVGVALAAEDLADARDALDVAVPGKVNVTLPPMDITTTVDLLATMTGLGVDFRDGLNGIYPGADVSAFVQQVRLEVTAKGTVGAAVTELVMAGSAPVGPVPEPIEFAADRPFHLAVLDTSTGWPLFLAQVTDAAAAGK